jgi:O-antigen/teichoic acid export membrane protein
MIYVVVGYALTTAAGPILSRLYSPTVFGLYGLFLAFPQVFVTSAALNFDVVAPAPPEDIIAANAAVGALGIAVIMSALLTLVYLAFVVRNLLGYGSLPIWSCWLFMPVLLAWSFTSTAQYWCIRMQRFQSVGIGTLLFNIVRAVAQILLAFTGLGWAAMALGELLGRTCNFLSYFFTNRHDVRRLAHEVNPASILAALRQYSHFVTVLLPPMAIDAALAVVALPVIGTLFGVASAGQYFLMKRVIDLPASLLARTIADAFYSQISSYAMNSPERIRPLLLRTFCLIFVVAGICAIPVMIFGPSLFAIIFGKPWREAGMLAAIMMPGLVVNLGASPVSRVFAVTRVPALRYAFTVTNLIGTTVTLAVAWAVHLTVVGTVIGLSLAQFIAYSVYFASAYVAAGLVVGLNDGGQPASR